MVCPETTACPVLQDSMANPETRDRLVWMAPQEDPDLSDQKEMTDSLEHQAKTVCPVCLVLKERPVSQVFLDKMDCPVKREREAWMASQERLDRKETLDSLEEVVRRETPDCPNHANNQNAERREKEEETAETASLDSKAPPDLKEMPVSLDLLDSPDKTVDQESLDLPDATVSTDRRERLDRRERRARAASPAEPASSWSDTVNRTKCLPAPTTTPKCGTVTVCSTWKETNALTVKTLVTPALA